MNDSNSFLTPCLKRHLSDSSSEPDQQGTFICVASDDEGATPGEPIDIRCPLELCEHDKIIDWEFACMEVCCNQLQVVLAAVSDARCGKLLTGVELEVVVIKNLDMKNVKALVNEKLDDTVKELNVIYRKYNDDHGTSLKPPNLESICKSILPVRWQASVPNTLKMGKPNSDLKSNTPKISITTKPGLLSEWVKKQAKTDINAQQQLWRNHMQAAMVVSQPPCKWKLSGCKVLQVLDTHIESGGKELFDNQGYYLLRMK
ncbi:hypothetical protein FRC11_008729 [Ceratobasidium sp. 423]|nr:hypothetical protein FRC11_008729 [Ceratobasidium sp. 423]